MGAARRLSARLIGVAACAMLASTVASAQFVQYTPPGSVRATQVVTKEQMEVAFLDARWRLGAWRFSPWYSLRNFGYNSNVFGSAEGEISDVTMTVGAGVRGYFRTGNLNFALHALPEYVWWARLSERRTLNGRYGLGVFGYFDRLTLELTATSSELQEYLSSEFEQPVNTLRQRGAATVEVPLAGRFGLFASGSAETWRYPEDSADPGLIGNRLTLLERDEALIRGGFRYRLADQLSFGVGVERSDVNFLHTVGDRSNEGTAPVLEVQFLHSRFSSDLSLAYRTLEPKDGSLFRPFQGATGNFQINWTPGSRLTYQLYGSRNLAYTLLEDASYFVDQRLGAGVQAPIGWRFRLRGFAETGKNDYAMLDSEGPQRSDDLTAFGVTIGVQLPRKFEFLVGVSQQWYDSNFPGADRSIFRLQTAVTVGTSDGLWF